jgi:hypothetical protein
VLYGENTCVIRRWVEKTEQMTSAGRNSLTTYEASVFIDWVTAFLVTIFVEINKK